MTKHLPHNLFVEYQPVETLAPYSRNARTHSKKQLQQIADSIKEFGFTNPILINSEKTIIAGHGRVLAAKMLGRDERRTIYRLPQNSHGAMGQILR